MIYVNGQPQACEVVRDGLTKQITGGGQNHIAIGARFRDRGFRGGRVDEFQVFDRRLAPLEVTQTSFSVSCPACGQWHTIDRSSGSPVAQPFEDADENVERPPQDAPAESAGAPGSGSAKSEGIARLDMAWEREKKKHLVFGISGEMTVPSALSAVVSAVVGAGGGGFFIYRENPLGWIILAVGVGFGGFRWWKAQAYKQTYEKYRRRRRMSSMPAQPPPGD